MASKYAKRAAMRARHNSFMPVRNIFTYAGQTLGAWNQQIDPLTQASLAATRIDTDKLQGNEVWVEITDLDYERGTRFDNVVLDDLTDGSADPGTISDGGIIVTGPVGQSETVEQCHTHTVSDWTGLGQQWINGETGPAIGTPDGHTHLVLGGAVQPVRPWLFPDGPPHTHISLTEV